MICAAIPGTSVAGANAVFPIQPLRVILVGAVFVREPVSRSQWIATPMALCGLALTTGLLDDMASAHPASHEYLLGLLFCLGGSLSYAAVTLLAKNKGFISPFTLSFWQCGVGTVLLAWAPLTLGWPQQVSDWAWL